ncbi:3-hydroxyacyl-CoA dehydrogenase, partial [Aureobasidium melanogenum]
MPAIVEPPQWVAPADYQSRNVVVLGGGVLGRRIATCWCSAGYNVIIRDTNQAQCDAALQYIGENVTDFATKATTGRSPGKASVTLDLEVAIQDAWIVFECVPEILDLKIDVFAELERLAPKDCILASNSSSYKSSAMLAKIVDQDTKTPAQTPQKKLIVLDTGLGQPLAGKAPAEIISGGRLLEVSLDGKTQRVLSKGLPLPDGVEAHNGKLYYTNMGMPSLNNGSVCSLNLDGTNPTTIVPPGKIFTPKQLSIDSTAEKLYIADREGCKIWRCNTDGSGLEVLIDAARDSHKNDNTPGDIMDQCIGNIIAPSLGKFFWTQKGPSKGNCGRIFSANIDFPENSTAATRTDISLVADKLPECIDLEYIAKTNTLYWTDRGEVPFGNCLYKAALTEQGTLAEKPQILAQNFNEAIGLKVDSDVNCIYVSDLGGSVWKLRAMEAERSKGYWMSRHRASQV